MDGDRTELGVCELSCAHLRLRSTAHADHRPVHDSCDDFRDHYQSLVGNGTSVVSACRWSRIGRFLLDPVLDLIRNVGGRR